jgi:lipopolysaccharide export system protein LptA
MSEQAARNVKSLHFRARMPQYFRIAAICALVVTVLAVLVGFYRERNRTPFKLKSEHTQLSQDVVAEVSGYERLETDGDIPKYYIKADRAITYSDNHQELENVFLQVYDDAGKSFDKMTAQKALYVPEENKNFTAYLAGDVNIETRDSLKVNTERITYTKAADTAEADLEVRFERDNIKGTSVGALVKIGDKKLELLKQVEIEAFGSPQNPDSNVRKAKISAGSATVDQLNNRFDLQHGTNISFQTRNDSNGQPRDVNVSAQSASALFLRSDTESPQLTELELFDNVHIESSENNGRPLKVDSGYALYDKASDKFELKKGVYIVTVEGEKPTEIRSNNAVYEEGRGKVALDGSAEITQGSDTVRGDAIEADLFPTKRLRYAKVRGNAYLKQATDERTSEVSGAELNAAFDEGQNLLHANSFGQSSATMTPVRDSDYARVVLSAPTAIRVRFRGPGALDNIETQGRTTLQLDANAGPNASIKRLSADAVRTVFNSSGKDIQKAEAVGSAELTVEPLQPGPENYKTSINAPRFDCEFYPTGNSPKTCSGATGAKAVRTPTIAVEGRGTQTLTADRLNAVFSADSKNIDQLTATGNARFNELDRAATAETISFTNSDQTVRLRGSEPTVWDSRARAKAREIDWDTKNQRSSLRGGVSTTYYNQKQTGGATPFRDESAPVFVTAETAEFDHREGSGTYSGNARGWQENNYVRAARFLIKQKQGQFFADGGVQSLLYNAKRKENGRESTVPVYAAAGKMSYDRASRNLRYEDDVDIRQGTDRVTAKIATVSLTDTNEVAQTVAENNVVISQPERKATGDFAQYTAADESVILRGSPARVEDRENGSSQGGQVIVYLRENRVVGEGKTKTNSAGRVRSVYKVRNN